MANRTVKYEAIVTARLPIQEALRLRELAEADDRPPSVLARRLILKGLRRSEERQRETRAAIA
jgi:predicted transcriptional regulator